MSSAGGLAILGAGIFATEAYLPAFAALKDTVLPLRAVYSRSQKSAQALSEVAFRDFGLKLDVYHDSDPSTDLQALLARNDISAVIIALPITLQPNVILTSLAAGKHVLSEKPIAADVAAGRELIKTYRSTYLPKGLIWRVAENFEAEPVSRTAAFIIKSGKIGSVNFFKASVVNYIDNDSKWYNTPWRTIPDYQGGFLLDGGVHTIAALRTILPHQMTHVSAFASLNKDYLKPHDTIHAIVRSDSNFHGVVDMTWASPTKARPVSDGFVVFGTKGWLSINMYQKSGDSTVHRIKVNTVIESEGKHVREEEETIDEAGKGVEVEVKSFSDAVTGQETIAVGDVVGALHDVAFIQAALNSEGSLVSLTELVVLE